MTGAAEEKGMSGRRLGDPEAIRNAEEIERISGTRVPTGAELAAEFASPDTPKLTLDRPIVFHFRLGKGEKTKPKAGATVVYLPEQQRFGLALCCDKDRYCRKWGRKVATERAKNGPSSRIRNKRFESSLPYSGPLEMKPIRESAKALAYFAAGCVDNPLAFTGSFFVGEEEQAALSKVGISRACPRDD